MTVEQAATAQVPMMTGNIYLSDSQPQLGTGYLQFNILPLEYRGFLYGAPLEKMIAPMTEAALA